MSDTYADTSTWYDHSNMEKLVKPVSSTCLINPNAWDLHDQKQLAELVDVSMGGDYNNEEAHKFLKISLLCTQDMPKQRPSMSKVVKMLAGEEPVDEQNISRPRLLSEFMNLRAHKEKADLTSEGTSKEGILSSSTENFFFLVKVQASGNHWPKHTLFALSVSSISNAGNLW
ncbi:hypothetical protein Gotur_032690, partial [Gossypium turneri]